jgi:alpha-methylacyl-CoA racemase
VTFSDTPAGIRGAPPVPGTHTRDVLAEHGYADAEIDSLVEAGVVASERRPRES